MRVPSALQAGTSRYPETETDSHPGHRPFKRTLKTCFIDDSPYNNLTPIPTLKWRLPTLLNSNTRSIVHKIDEMTNIIDDNEVDIACVTETWLSDEVPHCVTDIDGYTCERRDRVDRRGGGVLTYIRNSIPYHRLSILECDEVESLWLLVRDKCMPRNYLFAPTTLFPLSTRS